MTGHVCRCNIEDPHMSFGACMRSKNVGYVGCFPTKSAGAGRGDAMAQKRQDKELDAYAAARKEGIQPAGTQMHQVERAVRLSNDVGKAYDASAGTFV